MKPEAQRIAIAEACGLKPPFRFEKGEEGRDWQARKTIWTVPDYLNDLNAMHEAEKALTDEQWQRYTSIVNADFTQGSATIMKAICHATAAQRAEAFLRTIGKWEEDA